MKVCKICFKEFDSKGILSLFGNKYIICPECYKKFSPSIRRIRIDGIDGIILYFYDEIIRSLIYQFKGCYDIELAAVFLSPFKNQLRFLFHDFSIVPIPSYHEADKERGFNHVKEMYKVLELPIIECLYKSKSVKQAYLHKEERSEIKNVIQLYEHFDFKGKKLLICDDVLTSGNTIKRAVELLKERGAKTIKILIFASNCRNFDLFGEQKFVKK